MHQAGEPHFGQLWCRAGIVVVARRNQAAKLADFTWHDLRHTFASRLVMAGVDIRTVQELMGHKSISMTMRYSHLSPEHRTIALEKLCEASATNGATEAKTGETPVAPVVQ
jgi:hypothetical protein